MTLGMPAGRHIPRGRKGLEEMIYLNHYGSRFGWRLSAALQWELFVENSPAAQVFIIMVFLLGNVSTNRG